MERTAFLNFSALLISLRADSIFEQRMLNCRLVWKLFLKGTFVVENNCKEQVSCKKQKRKTELTRFKNLKPTKKRAF